MTPAEGGSRAPLDQLVTTWRNRTLLLRRIGESERAEGTRDCADELEVVIAEVDRLRRRAGDAPFRRIAERLVELDWCIGYELTEPLSLVLDDIRCDAAKLLSASQEGSR